MNRTHLLATCLLAGVALTGVGQASPAVKKDTGITQQPAAGLDWGQTPFGPDASPVSGNFAEGGHITFIKFPAGMKTPVHTHSHDYVGIVVKGVTRHYSPKRGSARRDLPTGSHWSVKADIPHISECLPGSECIMAIYQKDAFDFLPLENEPH